MRTARAANGDVTELLLAGLLPAVTPSSSSIAPPSAAVAARLAAPFFRPFPRSGEIVGSCAPMMTIGHSLLAWAPTSGSGCLPAAARLVIASAAGELRTIFCDSVIERACDLF